MKVEISRATGNRIKLTTKKRKKTVVISIFEEDEVNLKSALDSDSIEYTPLSYYIEAGITVTWAKNRIKIVDLLKEIDEEPDIVVYGENITTYRDVKAFKLDLIAYHIPSDEI